MSPNRGPSPNENPCASRAFIYGASRTRTGDLLGAIQALSQLSYSPVRRHWPRGWQTSLAPPFRRGTCAGDCPNRGNYSDSGEMTDT